MTTMTADLCDEYAADIQVAEPIFRTYGSRRSFGGQAVTLRVFEDNSLVRSVLEEAGKGQVLVVDGGASQRCALLGGNIARLAFENGWSGVIINGCIRDRLEVDATDIGVRALNSCPRKSRKQGLGERDVDLFFAGIDVTPGDYIFADEDGVVVSARDLSQSVNEASTPSK
ncbi:MAG: ribonuclease E activity regulator RraA [Proteobacteria bacterium]|nr:ribonuclease E activity regulator RraA [Pseudomonadota bacterium]